MEIISASIPSEIKAKLKQEAESKDLDLSKLIRQILRKYYSEN